MSDIEQVPLAEILEEPSVDTTGLPADIPETLPEAPPQVKAKAKAKMGRPIGKKDAKPRAKPKAKAKQRTIVPPSPEDSESSDDGASTQELHALDLIRSIRAYDVSRLNRKKQKYASWFGR